MSTLGHLDIFEVGQLDIRVLNTTVSIGIRADIPHSLGYYELLDENDNVIKTIRLSTDGACIPYGDYFKIRGVRKVAGKDFNAKKSFEKLTSEEPLAIHELVGWEYWKSFVKAHKWLSDEQLKPKQYITKQITLPNNEGYIVRHNDQLVFWLTIPAKKGLSYEIEDAPKKEVIFNQEDNGCYFLSANMYLFPTEQGFPVAIFQYNK